MLALTPPLFSNTYGWPVVMENLTPSNLQHDCNEIYKELEANLYNSVPGFDTYNQIQHDITPENSISSSSERCANDSFGDSVKVVKNLNHNASERDRRKRVNELYEFLRSLLPMPTYQKKKVSIPQTILRALKYIPELQREVEELKCKKEKLSLYSSSSANTSQDHLSFKKQSSKDGLIGRKSSVVSLVSVLSEKEAVIQLIFSTKHMSKNKDISCLSKVLEHLEHDEDECVLINSTTSIGSGEGMSINTLHLQAQGDKIFKAERLEEKLYYFHQQS